MPDREKAIAILEKEIPYERKQSLLRSSCGGKVFRYIADNHLASLRYSSCSIYFHTLPRIEIDTTETAVSSTPATKADSVVIPDEPAEDTVALSVKPDRWRISTNLLYWAVLAHNAGVEYSIDEHSYLSLNGGCAWWRNLSDKKAWRWIVGELAYMRNFSPNKDNCGWQAGVYTQTGEFELMNGNTNRKGEFTSLGLSAGYRWKIKEHSALHAEVGLGYMYIDYRYAVPMSGRLIYQGRNYVHYWGPTRASLSWVWYLNRK